MKLKFYKYLIKLCIILAYLWININQKQLQKFYNITDSSLLECHYQAFKRFSDKKTLRYGTKVQLSCGEKYLISDEFIGVQCFYGLQKYSEYHSFLPKKPEVLKRLKKRFLKKSEQENKMNVMILGIDSLSKLNFHRTMKKSSETVNKLGGIEFHGYNKVGKIS